MFVGFGLPDEPPVMGFSAETERPPAEEETRREVRQMLHGVEERPRSERIYGNEKLPSEGIPNSNATNLVTHYAAPET